MKTWDKKGLIKKALKDQSKTKTTERCWRDIQTWDIQGITYKLGGYRA